MKLEKKGIHRLETPKGDPKVSDDVSHRKFGQAMPGEVQEAMVYQSRFV
jgi:hypothetical protein